METLASAPAAGLGATHFVETGHGSMIAGVAKRTVPDVTVVALAEPSQLATVAALSSPQEQS
jgi:hypothetical protein